MKNKSEKGRMGGAMKGVEDRWKQKWKLNWTGEDGHEKDIWDQR